MRRVKKKAVKANLGTTTDAMGGPLLPKKDGTALIKKEMEQFFVDLEAATGRTRKRITGHSARVTGAMRMAFGGHSLTKIKIFGRWGSAAVERYVREAILGYRGGDVAQVTEGVEKALKELQLKMGKGRKGAPAGKKRKRCESDEE